MFVPRLTTLPPAQMKLWAELGSTPKEFALYGGTAIALRLGHRESVDFDFFSPVPFSPAGLKDTVPYLSGGETLQEAPNTLTMSIDRDGPVQVSYFGGLRLGQVEPHECVVGPEINVASLVDLAGMKVAVVTQRAELKDYLDIHALLTNGAMTLATMLSSARVIYGDAFSPLTSLKAISYHDDPSLANLPRSIRTDLNTAVRAVRVDSLPDLAPLRLRPQRP